MKLRVTFIELNHGKRLLNQVQLLRYNVFVRMRICHVLHLFLFGGEFLKNEVRSCLVVDSSIINTNQNIVNTQKET